MSTPHAKPKRPRKPSPCIASIAFLNCWNLFEAKACSRGPQSESDLAVKTQRLAKMLQSLAFAAPPVFLCFCELANENLGIGMATAAFPGTNYQPIWSGSPSPRDRTGLLILYDANGVTAKTADQPDRPLRGPAQRSRWLAARFSMPNAARELGIVLNHWSSGLHGESEGAYSRRRSADEIADLFRGAATLNFGRGPKMFERDDAVILAGDFNCDPFDGVMQLQDKGAWAASHAREAVKTAKAGSLPCFYNPMVKAPDIDGTTGQGLKSRMSDYLLFSKSFLTGGTYSYVDGSIRTSTYDRAASDHRAVGATFTIP